MSSSGKKSRKRWEYGHPPRHRGDRTVSCVSELSMTSTVHSTMSPKTRETLLKLKKIPEPFSEEMQDIFDDFITHVEDSTFESVNLSESSLLLSGVTKIFTAQVNSLQKSIMELAEFVTKTDKKPKERKETDVEKTKEHKDKIDEHGNQSKSSDGSNENETPVTLEVQGDMEAVEGPNVTQPEPGTLNSENNIENSSNIPTANGVENSSNTDDPITDGCDSLVESNTLGDEKSEEVNKSSTEGEVQNSSEQVPDQSKIVEPEGNLVDQVLYGPLTESAMKSRIVLGAGPVTRKRLMCFKDLLKDEPSKKKERFEIFLPPTLVTYYDEDISNTYAGDENPPELDRAPPPPEKRKRKTQVDQLSKELSNSENPDLPNIPEAVIKSESDQTEVAQNKPAEAVAQSGIAENLPMPSVPDFAPEDQASILECINELHYLPFTFELSSTDLSSAFGRIVDKICSIFQKYNFPLSRAMIKAASAMCSGMVPNEGSPTNGVNATLLKLNGMHETLLKNFGGVTSEKGSQETPVVEDADPEAVKTAEVPETPKKSYKTIFELTPEKTVAQSRETIKAMLHEMQRTIVPKYARIPMMEENTPEFFQRVTNFEKKMRKVLDAESTKEEFDVRKYEKEVLEVTAKETLEQEQDEIQVPLSPIINTVLDQPSDDESTNDLDLNFQGCSSSRSSFEGSRTSSVCGSRWVPLSHIFRHMKKLEKVEACRLFYAVLALLSYQNLDINYDQLYSEESARLTDKAFDHEQDAKYPRGVKIMTSRCPDVDKEEVYIAALTTKSRTQEFRDFLVQESNSLLNNNNNKGTESSLPNGDAHYGIQERKNSFVEEAGTDYVGQLYGKRGRRPAKTVPIPFVPFPLRR